MKRPRRPRRRAGSVPSRYGTEILARRPPKPRVTMRGSALAAVQEEESFELVMERSPVATVTRSSRALSAPPRMPGAMGAPPDILFARHEWPSLWEAVTGFDFCSEFSEMSWSTQVTESSEAGTEVSADSWVQVEPVRRAGARASAAAAAANTPSAQAAAPAPVNAAWGANGNATGGAWASPDAEARRSFADSLRSGSNAPAPIQPGSVLPPANGIAKASFQTVARRRRGGPPRPGPEGPHEPPVASAPAACAQALDNDDDDDDWLCFAPGRRDTRAHGWNKNQKSTHSVKARRQTAYAVEARRAQAAGVR